MNDLLGLGKILPMDKLLDVLTKSVGAIMKPYFDRRDVDTKAYEIRKITEAKVESMRLIATAVRENYIGVGGINYNENGILIESPKQSEGQIIESLSSPDLEERTRTRVSYQEAKKQQNIEGITSFAAEELRNESPVTDEPVDEAWSSRFFKYAEDISDEEMQTIWGKILAGEIKQPNTYSVRTLEVLRNLSKQEATIFSNAANYAFSYDNDALLFKENNKELKKYGLSFAELSVLRETGLLLESEFTSLNFQANTNAEVGFTFGNIVIIVKINQNPNIVSIPIYFFTQVGKQLLKLVNPTLNTTYLNEFATFLKNDYTTVRYAYILRREGESIHHTLPLLDFPIQQI